MIKNNNKGFTLVELIISLTLGLMLLTPILILPIQSYSSILQLQEYVDLSGTINTLLLQVNKDIFPSLNNPDIQGDRFYFNENLYYEVNDTGIKRVEILGEQIIEKKLTNQMSSFSVDGDVLTITVVINETQEYQIKFNLSNPLLVTETPVIPDGELNISDVKDVWLTGKGSFWLTADNKLYAVGDNTSSNLGLSEQETLSPILIKSEITEADSIYASNKTTFFVTDDEVYAMGDNSYGQLGLNSTENISNPTPISALKNENIQKIEATPYNTYFLTKEGGIFVSGRNDYGQLGLGHKNPVLTPTKINSLNSKKIIDIKSSGFHAIALDSKGNIYGWGLNSSGQIGGIFNQHSSPKDISVPKIEQIDTGYYHSIALGENGKVYVWGSNQYGQLGLGKYIPYMITPTRNTDLNRLQIKEIYAEAFHTIVVAQDGVYVFGSNNHNQLGIKNETIIYVPKKNKAFNGIQISEIKTNDYNTVIITRNGNIWVVGDNEKNQILVDNDKLDVFHKVK